jgi:hypothetical protein
MTVERPDRKLPVWVQFPETRSTELSDLNWSSACSAGVDSRSKFPLTSKVTAAPPTTPQRMRPLIRVRFPLKTTEAPLATT